MKMKTIYNKIFLLLIMLIPFTACEDKLDEINQDVSRARSVDPIFQLNRAIVNQGPDGANIVYDWAIIRQVHTPFRGVLEGANSNQVNQGSTVRNWNTFYPNVLKNLIDGINNLQEDGTRTNALSVMRIMKAYVFMVCTDTYGDIPYSEAGLGFIDQNMFPAYDPQESIYTDIISELQSATSALDAAGDNIGQEALFGGDIDKWIRFGNSLLLRAAMRLSKVNPSTAQTIVSGINQSNLMQSNLDNAFVAHQTPYNNGGNANFNNQESSNFYLDSVFVTHLQTNNDPRLEKIAIRYVGATSGNGQVPDAASTDPAIQVGLPQGPDQNGVEDILDENGVVSLYDFSQVNRNTVGAQEAPGYLVTYAQTMLLLAEARFRGWATGDAAEAYEEGIRAHMRQFAQYPASTAVEEADIDAYIAAHSLSSGTELDQINTEYWIASFLAGYDGWANFRRSGFPALPANPSQGALTGTSENFIRRLVYPDAEFSINFENLNAAVSRQGADLLSTRIWWDAN